MTRLLDQPDPDLEAHFKTLGVGSVSAYKLWCYRHGLSTDLHKSPEQRQSEIELLQDKTRPRDPDLNKRHDPRRAEWIARIFHGELQNQGLSDVLSRVRIMYNNLSEDPDAQQALGRLVLHVEKYGDMLRPMPAMKRLGNIPGNSCLAALEQLARHHAHWIRPVEDWRPDNSKQHHQFRSLARHLLTLYEIPQFFDVAFFQGNTPEARRQQAWFLHIAAGQNIRTAGVPMNLTKRMAHMLMQERGYHLTIYQTLRKVQYAALGGNKMCFWEIACGPLGNSLENEDFWETVVHFFANNPFLERSYITPIIDYIRNQKFTPQRIPQPDGAEREGPPPHPNFCMKGRSIDKLIRQVDVWHEDLTGLEDVPLQIWPSSGFKEFEHVAVDPELKRNLQWTVRELTTSQQLHVEGRVMHHCVGSYAKRCATGSESIWSLRALDLDAAEENRELVNVLTIAIDNKKKVVTQHRGKYNLQPFGKKHLAKQRKTGNIYLHLLRQAPTVMRLWMDREGLSYG